MLPQKKVFYFAVGQNSSPEMMQAITGNDKQMDIYVTELDGYELCIQTINDLPPLSQALIRKAWGENADSYRAYGLRPKLGSKVRGKVYALTEDQRDLVKNSELVDLGWHHEEDIKVTSNSRQGTFPAVTEVIGVQQSVSEVVDGLNYEPFLNPKDTTFKHAESAREDFLRQKLEGNPIPRETKG